MIPGSVRSLAVWCMAVTLLLAAACTQNVEVAPGAAPSTGGRLVVLLITDNSDHQRPNKGPGSIADGVTRNAGLMEVFFDRVRRGTGMTVDVQTIAGTAGPDDPFNCARIVRTIKALPVRAGDAVMVYYAGHGFNIGTDNPSTTAAQIVRYAPPEFRDKPLTGFPFLACGTEVANTPNLDMIATWLAEKRPRLTIVMADACSSFEGGSGPVAESFFASATRGLSGDERLRSLFVEARGTVLMTGSERGHYSYYDTRFFSPGGMFTKKFLSVLNAMPSGEKTTWQDVGRQLTPMTITVEDRRTRRITTDVQTPILHVGEPFATAVAMPR